LSGCGGVGFGGLGGSMGQRISGYGRLSGDDIQFRVSDHVVEMLKGLSHLALFWFGSIEADTIVAYGTLSRR
jgi:hypothetical protein